MSIQLIVNADDYGHTPGVSAGIREAHLHGIVTSTTALMNMAGVETELERARQDCPDLGLGVHLVLTSGCPVLPPQWTSSLIQEDGSFHREAALHERLALIDLSQVEAEWRAQVHKFTAGTGCLPDHLDAHHHVAYLCPGLLQIMLTLAQEAGCAIRLPLGESAAQVISDLPPEVSRHNLDQNQALLSQHRPRHPDRLILSFYEQGVVWQQLDELLINLPQGTSEMMCHPGYCDALLREKSIYSHQREKELGVLTDPAIRKTLQDHQITLINYAQL